ncbi:ornithine cyclodeaminase family protein [Martelella sp. FOR1707]
MRIIGKDDVSEILDYETCIAVVRDAMKELSEGITRHILRQVIPAEGGNVLSLMGGVMPPETGFGSKVISVFPQNARYGRQSHQGVVVLFDPETGEPLAVVHAGDLTRIRTAAASAVATDVLARPDSSQLAVLGYGEQGLAHIEAIAHVRPISKVSIWGRSPHQALHAATTLSERLQLDVIPADTVRAAVRDADIVSTTTAAPDPILLSDWIADGTHINVVGSSVADFSEIDSALVKRARFIADHREGVLRQGGEFLRAREAGLINDVHVVGEIGDVLNGTLTGRTDPGEVTIYKSLGHIVQDLACARRVYEVAEKQARGFAVAF